MKDGGGLFAGVAEADIFPFGLHLHLLRPRE